MPIAHIRDVAIIHPPTRRVTGSFDPPLNAAGRQQAAELAGRFKGKVDRVFTSPMKRAVQTASLIAPEDHFNGEEPRSFAKVDPGLAPMRLGVHEGQPSDAARPKIQALFHSPDKHPGKSPLTGEPGETANQFRVRVLRAVQHRIATKKPNETVVDMTHGRDIKLVDSWLRAGMKPNLAIDVKHMTSKTGAIAPGALYHVDTANRRLAQVNTPVKGGYHLARHGATNFNPPEAEKGADAGS